MSRGDLWMNLLVSSMRSMRGGFIFRSRGVLLRICSTNSVVRVFWVFLSLYHFVSIFLSFPFLISNKSLHFRILASSPACRQRNETHEWWLTTWVWDVHFSCIMIFDVPRSHKEPHILECACTTRCMLRVCMHSVKFGHCDINAHVHGHGHGVLIPHGHSHGHGHAILILAT